MGEGEGSTLLQMRKLLFELVGEAEGYDGEARVVVCGRLVFFREDLDGGAEEGVRADWAVDVGDAGVPVVSLALFLFS